MEASEPSTHGVGVDPIPVFDSGKRVDAELIAGMLRTCGVYAEVWTNGLQWWTIYSASGEMSGIPNEFGSNRVMVRRRDASLASQLIASSPLEPDDSED
jgi:hypothetical protein